MSFLLNLNAGLAEILSRHGDPGGKIAFEVRVNNWKNGDPLLPEYFGMCEVTPDFLRDFRKLCEKHKCGEKE